MDKMREKLEKIQDEIEELEESEMSWSNLEKLSILYNVEHHMCKKMEMMGESLYSGGDMGFREVNENSRQGNTREMRELANNMSKQQLTDVVVGYARELNQSGNRGGYNSLYNRMSRYGGNGGGNGNGNGR